MSYFKNFPRIYYNDRITRNLLLKSKFFQEVLDNYTNFYPYTIANNERADMIAHHYYGHSDYTWLVYFSNNIIDPYTDWCLTDSQLEELLKKKYGSLEQAMETIVHYRYNVNVDVTDDVVRSLEQPHLQAYIMPLTTYVNLSVEEKSFWTPKYAYEYEQEKNESKRDIQLLDNDLLNQVDNEISRIFS